MKKQHGLGTLYLAFDSHKEGLEACAAVEALIEISAIETLRSSFLLPLQGDAVKAEVRALARAWSLLRSLQQMSARHRVHNGYCEVVEGGRGGQDILATLPLLPSLVYHRVDVSEMTERFKSIRFITPSGC